MVVKRCKRVDFPAIRAYIKVMDPTKPIPVRFSDSTIERLDRTAKEIGNTRAGLMRYLIEVWLDGFDVHGKGVVAKEWPELIRSFDERRQAKKEQKVPPAWANGGIDTKTVNRMGHGRKT